ncbi:MAG TPA: 50S ribosomal protein L20 [Patescibacteria group bacterium]|nr:50S ribosomal protein L20 [Patescibacteria group bacterium]
MTRIKRGVMTKKRHKNVLKATKGYKWGRKNLFRKAREAVIKAGKYAHRDRRAKKRSFRSLWITRLNTALRLHGITYRAFIALTKKKNIALDRKVLSELAVDQPEIFKMLIEKLR